MIKSKRILVTLERLLPERYFGKPEKGLGRPGKWYHQHLIIPALGTFIADLEM